MSYTSPVRRRLRWARNVKFRDYEAAVTPGVSRHVPYRADLGVEELVGRAGTAPRQRIDELCDGLEDAVETLRHALSDQPRFPFGIARVMGSTR